VKVVVLGGGRRRNARRSTLRRFDDEVEITLVESRLVGGECSYFACMPTKCSPVDPPPRTTTFTT
jgi:pyruvate/2-oxoglutarate dehydrogenase complex dihydrolipoamide dehydrogenase (E3) component